MCRLSSIKFFIHYNCFKWSAFAKWVWVKIKEKWVPDVSLIIIVNTTIITNVLRLFVAIILNKMSYLVLTIDETISSVCNMLDDWYCSLIETSEILSIFSLSTNIRQKKKKKQQLSTNNEIIELLCRSHWEMNQWFHLYFSNCDVLRWWKTLLN